MHLTRKQRGGLRLLEAGKPPKISKLSAQDKANLIYKMRKKLRSNLDILDDIGFLMNQIPDDHVKKATKRKDIENMEGLIAHIKRIRPNLFPTTP